MFGPSNAAACDVLGNPASRSEQRWHAYRVLLDILEPCEHIWCQYAESARFLCGLLEFPDSDLWKRFQLLLRSMSCHACVAVWSESVNKFLESLSNRFEDYSIDTLESHMIEADVARLKSLSIDNAVFELLQRVHLGRNRNLNRIMSLFLEENAHHSAGRRAVILKNGELAPSVYLFCLHPKSVVRCWCQNLVRTRSSGTVPADGMPSCVVNEILAVLSKNLFENSSSETADLFLYDLPTFWSGLKFLLNSTPEDVQIATATKFLCSRSGMFLEKLLSHSRLVTLNGKESYSNLCEMVPENILSPTLSCLSWLMLNASQIFWEKGAVMIGPAVFADILRKGVLYATRSLEALVEAPYIALKIIDIIPIFVMSLPEKDRCDYIGSAVRFLMQLISNFPSAFSQKVVISLRIYVWSAVFKIIRCSFMMNSGAAAILCSDAWATPLTAFACSDFSSKSTEFLEFCTENIKANLISDAIESLRIALHHDVDNLKRIFITDESLIFALDDKHNRVFTSNALWIYLSTKYKPNELPSQLLEIFVSAAFQAVAIPPSFVALGFDQPNDVLCAYNTVRFSAQTILNSLSSHPKLIQKLTDSRADIASLFLLLISYRDSSPFISELIRKEVQSTLKLSEKPSSVNNCLSILYQYQSSQIVGLYLQCFNFCTNATIFHSIEKLVKNTDNLTDSAGRFLADLYPAIFWLDRLLHLFTDRSEVLLSLDPDSLWKLFFILIVSCIGFHLLPEFDRTFSALYDMGMTLLSLKPAFLTSFREFFKSWLTKRELIPSGTRRRWFQFVRSYIRIFPDEKDVARSVLRNYHGDALWLYQKGLSDQAQRNYLANLVPSIFNETQQNQELPYTKKSSGNGNGAGIILANLPALPIDNRRRDIGSSLMHTISLSKASSIYASSSLGISAQSINTPLRSTSLPYRSFCCLLYIYKSVSDNLSSVDGSMSTKADRLRAGFLSLRDDLELSKHASVIKSISAKPLTSVRASSDLKRRGASGKTAASSGTGNGTVAKIEKLPVRSVGHFLNIVLDWSLSDVISEALPKQLSETMLDPLPKSFDSFAEYRKAYGPLLLEETRAMIQNDYESSRDLKPNLVVKQGVDTTPHCSLPGSLLLCSPADVPENQRFSESDLLLVWPVADDDDFTNTPASAVFGVVDGQSNSTRLLIRVTRCSSTDSRFRNQLAFLRISSLVTAQRMARALESVARLRLGPSVILGHQETGALEDSFDIEDPVLSSLNTSQKSAIMHCICSKDPVVLLQGPPGTGKSTVIVALIQALLRRSFNRNANQLGQGWRKSTEFDSRHILLCTPSNAAADELTSRLVSAKIQAVPETTQYPVIRYGSNVTSDINAESVSLDRLVSITQSAQIRSGSQLDPNVAVCPTGTDRRSIQEWRERLLSEANVLVCTLSGSGAPLIGNIPHVFQVVIVDEAAQAHEIETLIPLQYSCRKLILVGDPKQLPATVLSTCAGKFGLNRSMFERLETVIQPVMLTEQYRMHPDICLFPSKQFYHGRVITAVINRSVPLHSNPFTRPYLFFDVQSEDRMVNFSRKNVTEAEFVVHLLCHIERTVALYGMIRPSIGVVTPYQAQVQEIHHQASSLMKQPPDVRTIDSFQGQERDIIIISAVRASPEKEQYKGLGFVSDERRLNVALTRAKLCCLVVGSARTLSDSVSVWKDLIADAKDRKCLISVPPKSFHEFLQQSHGIVKKRASPSSLERQSLSTKKSRSTGRGFILGVVEKHTGPRDPKQSRFDNFRVPVSTNRGFDLERNRDAQRFPALERFQTKRMGQFLSPSRRRKVSPGKRFQHAAPDPEAIRKQAALQSGSLANRQIPTGAAQSRPTDRHELALQISRSQEMLHGNVTAVLQKSTATLALDDILGAM